MNAAVANRDNGALCLLQRGAGVSEGSSRRRHSPCRERACLNSAVRSAFLFSERVVTVEITASATVRVAGFALVEDAEAVGDLLVRTVSDGLAAAIRTAAETHVAPPDVAP